MNKNEFINIVDNFLSNIELEFIDINGQLQKQSFTKLLKTTDIILNDLPFDTIEKIFYTKTEFLKIDKEYYCIMDINKTSFFSTIDKFTYTEEKPDIQNFNVLSTGKIFTKDYNKIFLNNTYLKFNDYLFFKKYFNLDLENVDIYYPIKIINKKNFTELEKLFNVNILYFENLTSNTDIFKIENNEIVQLYYLRIKTRRNENCEIYHNFYYNFYEQCSLFNIIKYFILGLLQYRQIEENNYKNIPLEKVEISKIDENIDKTVSQNMIEPIGYNVIDEQELYEQIQPIPTEILYENEQHIILQGVFEDIQKFCNNIEKYIAGAKWKFDNNEYEQLQSLDEKINFLEDILKSYDNNKLDMRGYNSYYRAVKQDIIVGDSDKLNYVNLTETQNNFLHIEKILQDNNYPLFAKLSLISQIKNTINIYMDIIKKLADNKQFYNEQSTEVLLPQLRSAYNELAKAVASQEQPASFGSPNYDGNPNEYPFRQEQP